MCLLVKMSKLKTKEGLGFIFFVITYEVRWMYFRSTMGGKTGLQSLQNWQQRNKIGQKFAVKKARNARNTQKFSNGKTLQFDYRVFQGERFQTISVLQLRESGSKN